MTFFGKGFGGTRFFQRSGFPHGPLLKKFLIPALLLALLLVFFWRMVFLGDVALPANHTWDPLANFYPIKLLTAQIWRGWELPLWNPYILGGTPLLADVLSAPFFPLDVPFYLFPNPVTYSWLWAVYLFFGGLFTYLYLREITRGGWFGPLVGAVVFMFNGTTIGILTFKVHVATILWLPLILLLLERTLTRRTAVWAALAALAFGVQLLAGHTQSAFYSYGIAALYIIFRLRSLRGTGPLLRPGLLCLLAMVAGVLVGAVQLIPSAELTSLSARDIFVGEHYLKDGWPPSRFLAYLVTSFTPELLMRGDQPIPTNPFLQVFDMPPRSYLGLMPLFFVAICALCRRDFHARFFTGLAVAFLAAFALLNTPLRDWTTQVIPAFDTFLHRKAVTIYFLVLSLMAGIGASYFVTMGQERLVRNVVKWLAVLWALALVGFTAVTLLLTVGKGWLRDKGISYVEGHGFGTSSHPEPAQFYYEKVDFYLDWFRSQVTLLSPAVYVPLILGAATLLALWLCIRGKLPQRTFQLAALAVGVADLFYLGMKYQPYTPRDELYPEQPAIAYLQDMGSDGQPFRVLPGILEQEDASAVPLEHYQPFTRSTASQKITPVDTAFATDSLIPYGLASAIGYESLTVGRYADFALVIDPATGVSKVTLRDPGSHLIDMVNARYVLSRRPLEGGGFRLLVDGEVKLYEDLEAMPRAWIVRSAEVVPKGEILARLSQPGFNFAERVLLEEAAPEVATLSPGGESQVRVTRYEANRVSLEATLDSGGLLVLADTYYPGWKAYVDGEETKVYPVNYVLRGVFLPPGEHLVEFVYDPTSVKAGSALTLAGLAGIVVVLTMALWRRSPVRRP